MKAFDSETLALLKEFLGILSQNNNYKAELEQNDDAVIIKITDKDWGKELKEYLNTLDDDVFIAACELYTKAYNEDLSKIKKITPDIIARFKKTVKVVVNEKIQNLRKKYGC